MNALIIIGFIALVIMALGLTVSALATALVDMAFGDGSGHVAYVMAVIAVCLWIAVYFLSPFEFAIKGSAA